MPPAVVTPWPTTMDRQASMPAPPNTPLPPIPVAYVPYKYQPRSRRQLPPQRPARSTSTRSFMVASLPPTRPSSALTRSTTALTRLRLAALARNDSLTSVYSRSTSGGSLLPVLSEGGRTLSPSSSSSTLSSLRVVSELGSWEGDDVMMGGISPLEPEPLLAEKCRTKSGVMKGCVQDTWIESPNLLQTRVVRRETRKIRKIPKESGREHNMF